jgi:hypothetical protein
MQFFLHGGSHSVCTILSLLFEVKLNFFYLSSKAGYGDPVLDLDLLYVFYYKVGKLLSVLFYCRRRSQRSWLRLNMGLCCLLRRFSGLQIFVKMFRNTSLFKKMLRFKNLFKKIFRFTNLCKKMFTFRFTILFKKIFMFTNLFFSTRIGQHCRLPLAHEKQVLVGLKRKYFGNIYGTYRHPHILHPEKWQTVLRNFSWKCEN